MQDLQDLLAACLLPLQVLRTIYVNNVCDYMVNAQLLGLGRRVTSEALAEASAVWRGERDHNLNLTPKKLLGRGTASLSEILRVRQAPIIQRAQVQSRAGSAPLL